MPNSIKTSEPRRRGRPPAYDREAALAALTGIFWQRGFSAASLDLLAQAADMNRPSLYAAFGDKRAMFRAVLEGYADGALAQIAAALASDPDPRRAVAATLRAAAAFYAEGAVPRGCLAICTVPTEAVADPDLRAALADLLAGIDALFIAGLEQARATGRLAPDFDCEARGRLCAAALHSLALRARAGAAPAALFVLADAAAATLV